MSSPALFSTEHQTPLATIASHRIAHLPPQSSLLEAVRLLARLRISSLLILDEDGRPLGILSEQVLLAALHAATPPQTLLSEVMAPPVTVPATIGCAEAYRRCLRQGVQHLVLVDEQQRAVAVVSDTDYRRHLDLQAPAGQTRIGSIMSRAVAILPSETPLGNALTQMHTRMCGVVIIVDAQQKPVGILAERDLARLYLDDVQTDERSLAEVMTTPVRTLPMDTTLAQAAEAMLAHRVRQYPVVDETGALVGMIAAREVTQAMAFGMMETSLAREQTQLQQLLEQAPFPLVISRIDTGQICYLNTRAEQQFHLRREQLLGQPVARFYQHPEDRGALLAQLQRDGYVFDQELSLLDINGHPYTALVSLSLVEFEQQPAIITAINDITQRKQFEQDLVFRNILLSTQQDASIDGILVVDEHDQILSHNQRFAEMWRVPEAILQQSRDSALLKFVADQLQDTEAFVQQVRAIYAQREKIDQTTTHLADGRIFDRYTAPLIDQQQRYLGRVWFFRDITEQKARERALAEGEKRLKTITDSALDGILMLDATGRICYWNPAAETIFGYQTDEAMGKNLHRLLAPARYHDAHRAAFDHFLNNGEGSAIGKTLELRALRKDGTEFTIALSLSSVYLNDQWHAVGIVRDISELKANQAAMESALEEAETANRAAQEVLAHLEELVCARTAELDAVNERLLISEERYTHALAATTDGLWDWNMASGELYCNPAYYRMLGYEPGELVPTMEASGVQLVHPDDREIVVAAMQQLLAESGSVELEYRMVTKAGGFVWVLSRSKVVARDADGRPLRTVGIHTDLTARKQTETALLLAAEEQQAIFNAAGMGIFLVKNRVLVRCNKRLEEVFGYTQQELTGFTTERWYLSQAEYLQWGQTITNALLTEGIFHAELQLRRKDGSLFWARTTAQALDRSNLAKGIVGMLDDITHEREASEALHRAKEVAEAATRAKSDFLANMSHEIRTPLNAILGFAHLLRRDPLTQQQLGQLDKLADASRHLLHVINDILDISKIEANKMAIDVDDFEPARVIDQVCSIVSDRVATKNIQLKVNIDHLPVMVRGDGPRLGQILLNLVGNAVKFTEQQGQVTLTARIAAQEPDQLILHFTVEDTGIGMSEEETARLFRAFEQADSSTTRRFGGTGLGLAISKRLVELMGGRIGVQSRQGQGTRFWVELPFAPSLLLPKVRIQGAALLGKRVLVIDDSPESREIMALMLEEIGMEVALAISGEEGLNLVQAADRAGRPFALLMVDWRLGGIDGLTTLEHLQSLELSQRPSLLMVTAYSDDLPRNQAIRAGINKIITKPVTPSLLVDAIVETMLPAVAQQETDLAMEQVLQLRSGATILVVEDNLVNQEVAQMLLESMGMTVRVADNGEAAVELVARESFDLVFMDIQMPVMDGLEATRVIRRRPDCRSLPILAMTANAFSEDREQCLAAGMDDHIAKPIELEKLQHLLIKWLQPRPQYRADEPNPSAKVAPTDLKSLIRTIDGVDAEAALRLLQGDADNYLQLLTQFTELHGDDVQLLTTLAASDNQPALRARAHALKGVAATLGARRVAELATDIERMAGEGGAVERLLPRIEALRPVLSTLCRAIARLASMMATTEPAPAFNQEQVTQVLDRMEELLAIEDSAVNDLFAANHALLAVALGPQARLLRHQIDIFDYADALATVRSLRGRFSPFPTETHRLQSGCTPNTTHTKD